MGEERAAGWWVDVPEYLADALDVYAPVLEFGRHVRHTFTGLGNVADESRAADELRYAAEKFGSPDLALRVHRAVNLWGVVAADFIGGLAALCRAREVIAAPFPLVRACVEYCVRIVWLLDNEGPVTPEKRFARAVLDEILSADEACKATSHLGGKGGEAHKAAKAELVELRTEVAPSLGVEVQLEGGPRTWRIGDQELLSPTDAIRHFGTRWGDPTLWEGTYDALSAYTHPGLLVADFFESGIDGESLFTTDLETIKRTLLMALVPYYQALKHHLAYNGWVSEDFTAWERTLGEVFPGFFLEVAAEGGGEAAEPTGSAPE